MAKATQKEYLDHSTKCPHCRSGNITPGSFEADGPEGTQEITCLSCKEKWYDCYKLTGYEVITIKDQFQCDCCLQYYDDVEISVKPDGEHGPTFCKDCAKSLGQDQ